MTQGDRVKDVRKTLKLTLEEFGKKRRCHEANCQQN